MSPWTHILSADEIAAFHTSTAEIDPGFAARQRQFYEDQSAEQCDALAYQAWLCNECDAYQISRSYAALKRAA